MQTKANVTSASMLYDMDYRDPKNIAPNVLRAVMRNGVIDVAGSEVFR